MCPLQYEWDTLEAPRKNLNNADSDLPISVHKTPDTYNIPSNQVLINPDIVNTDICEDDLNIYIYLSITIELKTSTADHNSGSHGGYFLSILNSSFSLFVHVDNIR